MTGITPVYFYKHAGMHARVFCVSSNHRFCFRMLRLLLPKVTTKLLFLRCSCNRKSNHCSVASTRWQQMPHLGYLLWCSFSFGSRWSISPTFLVFPGGRMQRYEKTAVGGQWLVNRWAGGFLVSHPSCLWADWAWSGQHLQTVMSVCTS